MKASIFVCLALIAFAGFAQVPGESPAPAPAVPRTVASPAAPAGAVFTAKKPLPTKSTCTANCGPLTRLQCTGSGTCSAADRDCGSNQQGYVSCDGGTTYCQPSCACSAVCNCAAHCLSAPCDSGGGYITDCAAWGICDTSCYCGGQCLRREDPPPGSSSSLSGGACATPAPSDPLLAKIFS